VINELRNELGTGHGRAKTPRVSGEAALAVSDAATLWVRWALARLDDVLGGDVDLLIHELRYEIWHRGELNRRFDEVQLDSLFADDQRRVGVAVAGRSMRGTGVVRESGVDPLLDRPQEWPPDYRLGVAEGLVINEHGDLSVKANFVPVLASIVREMATEDVVEFFAKVASAPLLMALAMDKITRSEVRDALAAATSALPQKLFTPWSDLRSRFADTDD
jgi:hypothetical protein